MTEQWKPLEWDPEYKVSDHGRVIGPRGRVLKPQPNGPYGYL